jgi:hypothetical protein
MLVNHRTTSDNIGKNKFSALQQQSNSCNLRQLKQQHTSKTGLVVAPPNVSYTISNAGGGSGYQQHGHSDHVESSRQGNVRCHI